ncbi:thioredoxin family protein [Staphylothermus hellenicus]|uniref:Thioredoxin domain-containing protein n=1 Tax=Staphylothermus hellenicus (strain DSM 12710 / JCM 10830 / BK20S6-10-b1 / P8) TaxID=591019 RepID=D7D940_STAHD|nr:thioredoxin family protein [Staphylothermus hellenicus]ADI32286.1 hypothetical protein Shell_1186 [Staphylothermus hellenicus DSM 12710]
MSLVEISSKEEFFRAVKSNDVVIIEYYNQNSVESKKFSRVVKQLSRYADPRILFLRINIGKNPDLGEGVNEIPCIRVYYKGKMIFEQKGSFGREDLDLFVLRRSIRSVFYGFNIAFKI